MLQAVQDYDVTVCGIQEQDGNDANKEERLITVMGRELGRPYLEGCDRNYLVGRFEAVLKSSPGAFVYTKEKRPVWVPTLHVHLRRLETKEKVLLIHFTFATCAPAKFWMQWRRLPMLGKIVFMPADLTTKSNSEPRSSLDGEAYADGCRQQIGFLNRETCADGFRQRAGGEGHRKRKRSVSFEEAKISHLY